MYATCKERTNDSPNIGPEIIIKVKNLMYVHSPFQVFFSKHITSNGTNELLQHTSKGREGQERGGKGDVHTYLRTYTTKEYNPEKKT